MSCRCPHHVRHGSYNPETGLIEFQDICGLRIKQSQDPEAIAKKTRGRGRPSVEPKRPELPEGVTTACINYPFPEQFDYFTCEAYQQTFRSKGLRNGALPTKDIQFSESLSCGPITEMELL